MGLRNLITQCRTVLVLVHELHVCGYQRLRAVPEMEPSGNGWRCAIAPVSLVSAEHGARLGLDWRDRHDSHRIATYTSRDENRYFEWNDIYPYATAKELALYFLERFPQVAEAGEGSDWLYAGWYMDMLRLTEPDRFPYAGARSEVPDTYLPTASPARDRPNVRIPLPPPGEALAARPGRSGRPGRRELPTLPPRRTPSLVRRRLAV